MQDQAPGFFRTRFCQNRNHDRVLAVRPRDHRSLQPDTGASGLLPRMLPEPQSHGRRRRRRLGVPFPAPMAATEPVPMSRGRRLARRALVVLATLVAVHLALCAGLYVAMLQPPDVFGRVIAKTPFPLMMALPFETLW